jgi:hypothetical protein
VGAQLEGVVTDAFAGYLIRDHVRAFFGTGNPTTGLRTALIMIQHRLREAVLGHDYDPEVLAFIDDRRRLAVGGGATGTTRVTGDGIPQPDRAVRARAPALLRTSADP